MIALNIYDLFYFILLSVDTETFDDNRFIQDYSNEYLVII